jgi:hypothetical protein
MNLALALAQRLQRLVEARPRAGPADHGAEQSAGGQRARMAGVPMYARMLVEEVAVADMA